MPAAMQFAPEHDADTGAGAHRQDREVVHALGDAAPLLADGGQVDVVLERDREGQRVAERLRESLAAQPDDAAGEADHVPRPDHPRHADDGRVDQVLAQPRRLEQRSAHLVHDRQHARRVGTVQLDVLARADGPGEVGDGGAQVAGADVDAEHDRGVRHRLEEHGAVARPVRPRRGLAHQPGLDQRPQRAGDGRLGDARLPRHLRARDRCRPADHVQHGALVERPQQGRGGADGVDVHIGRDLNEKPQINLDRPLDFAVEREVESASR